MPGLVNQLGWARCFLNHQGSARVNHWFARRLRTHDAAWWIDRLELTSGEDDPLVQELPFVPEMDTDRSARVLPFGWVDFIRGTPSWDERTGRTVHRTVHRRRVHRKAQVAPLEKVVPVQSGPTRREFEY